jgi:hypothetical protein
MLVLWKISISHDFTSLWTFSSSDPGGHIFNKKLQQLQIKLIYIYIYIYIERERERERETHTHTHTNRRKEIKEGDLSSTFFKELVDNTIVRETKPPLGVLRFFFTQVITILVLLSTWRCHLLTLVNAV